MRKLIIAILCPAALALAAYWACFDVAVDAQEKKAEKVSAAEIEKLIQQLGSPNGATRETASKALLKIGEPALPFLAKAKKADNLELRRRAENVYAALLAAADERRVAGLIAHANEFGIDVLIEQVVASRDQTKKEQWKALMGFAEILRKEAHPNTRDIQKDIDFLSLPITSQREFVEKTMIVTNGRFVAESVTAKRYGIDRSLVVARDFVVNSGAALHSIVLTAGQFKATDSTVASVVICAGEMQAKRVLSSGVVCRKDLVVEEELYNSLVVCLGDIHIKGNLSGSSIRCSGKVRIDGTLDHVEIAARGIVQMRAENEDSKKIRRIKVRKLGEGENTLGRFFTPKLLGADLVMEKKGARVAGIAPRSVLASAGLKTNDRIVAVNGHRFKNIEELTLLMRKNVVERTAVYTILRDSKSVDFKAVVEPNRER